MVYFAYSDCNLLIFDVFFIYFWRCLLKFLRWMGLLKCDSVQITLLFFRLFGKLQDSLWIADDILALFKLIGVHLVLVSDFILLILASVEKVTRVIFWSRRIAQFSPTFFAFNSILRLVYVIVQMACILHFIHLNVVVSAMRPHKFAFVYLIGFRPFLTLYWLQWIIIKVSLYHDLLIFQACHTF